MPLMIIVARHMTLQGDPSRWEMQDRRGGEGGGGEGIWDV